jgi:hypothetical protein
MKLFGFQVSREDEDKNQENLESFVPKDLDSGAIEIAADGASYSTYVDFENKSKHEGELITKYREMSTQPECDIAIQDIINEAIVSSDDGDIIEINVDKLKYSASIKKKITDEFHNILKILDFNNRAYEIFRRFYVDGRLYYHIVVDVKKPKEGIKELRYIDPRRIRKMRKSIKKKDPVTGMDLYVGNKEFFLYNSQGVYNSQGAGVGIGGISTSFPIAVDSVCFVHSGLMDPRGATIYSHLHKAIKPLNQLSVLEDATVIYRLTRAPERRVFEIDVGQLQKGKAEQHVRDMMIKHKNKVVYDASTGKVKDDRRFMTMTEDYWFPSRDGRGTKVNTIPAGQNLGQIEDVEFFQQKMYKSLNVPLSRLQQESTFSMGRGSEITRDEVKFSKFIDRIRNDFSEMFDFMLEMQLSLKGIINRSEWALIRQEIAYDFQNDNHFTELKEAEIWRERVSLLDSVDAYVGRYFSTEWVQKNVLKFSEEDIKLMEKQMDENGDDVPDSEEQPARPVESEPPAPPAEPSPQPEPPQPEPPQTGDNKPTKTEQSFVRDELEEELKISEIELTESLNKFLQEQLSDENI